MLSRNARHLLVGLGLICAGAFAAGGLRYTTLVDRTPPDTFDYAFWGGISVALLLPLWAVVLAPARWPRVAAGLRRLCAVYLAAPLAISANVVVHGVGHLNGPWLGIAVLATLALLGAQIILIRPDVMRSRQKLEDY